jgi:hypothetical protein
MDPNVTMPRPLGGETYQELVDAEGKTIILTYNDLWMLIVCRSTMDGDWIRMRESTSLVADSPRKRTIVERLWKLEQSLGGLPAVSAEIQRIHMHRAHLWFNQRPVSSAKNW